ncbi:hypothetical protein W97_02642 [Coniosporium apollinis CBS 100218]|uniref:Metallo-beta-lactamase domain-containing protein n=1 Tax=Coniosporium apollinis (strain CBS 100218) TaxID=1168221 RepID=R7YNA7_CONA1|nr:uncharacterized protein W97_02642 [Coniosporium apollinis CBS 100218]EON63415.1 hypothetical protein W97_02642 [Coniosporium apollinis CBS 100218]
MLFSLVYGILAAARATAAPQGPAASNTVNAPQYAPVPTGAFGPNLTAAGYRVETFGGGAYMVTDNLYQALFLVSDEGVIVVDNPPTIGMNMIYAVGNVTDAPITHVVYSHAHADHIGGAFFYGDNITIIAHRDTEEELSLTPDPNRPLPDVTFTKRHKVCVGNQTLELEYKGPNHQPGNIFIYARSQKVLMLVDVVFPGWVPFAYLAQSQNIPGWILAHDQILEYDFDYYVGGHLTRYGVRADVETQKEYVLDLKNNCEQALILSTLPPNATNPISAFVIVPAVFETNPGNVWASFREYEDAVARYCEMVTNQKWLTRLGGADVYGFSNAYQMAESLRIDYNILGQFAGST